MSIDALMDFRNAYLRAIAQIWRAPNSILTKQLMSRKVNEVNEALAALGRDHRWSGMDVVFAQGGAEWGPEDTGSWFGDSDSTITLSLPLDTAKAFRTADEKYWPQALADFYQKYPTMLGSIVPSGKETGAFPTGLGSWGHFLEFGGVIVRAMGIAWKNEKFRDDLLLKDNAMAALQGWLGYTCPWNIAINIENTSDDVFYDPPTQQQETGEWDGLEGKALNTLDLHVPQAPSGGDARVLPVALAAYNNTGPAYPFTCCI